MNPGAEAVTVATCVPSKIVSSVIVILKVALVRPARTVTFAGTVISEPGLVESVTVRLVASGARSSTWPATVPSPSVALGGALTNNGGEQEPYELRSLAE